MKHDPMDDIRRAEDSWLNAENQNYEGEELPVEKHFHCPTCYFDVTDEVETEFGIICPKCHSDFWRSECTEDIC